MTKAKQHVPITKPMSVASAFIVLPISCNGAPLLKRRRTYETISERLYPVHRVLEVCDVVVGMKKEGRHAITDDERSLCVSDNIGWQTRRICSVGLRTDSS